MRPDSNCYWTYCNWTVPVTFRTQVPMKRKSAMRRLSIPVNIYFYSVIERKLYIYLVTSLGILQLMPFGRQIVSNPIGRSWQRNTPRQENQQDNVRCQCSNPHHFARTPNTFPQRKINQNEYTENAKCQRWLDGAHHVQTVGSMLFQNVQPIFMWIYAKHFIDERQTIDN